MSIVALKVRIKSLAAESTFTKKEIRKQKLVSSKKIITDKKTNTEKRESNKEFLARRKALKQKLTQEYGVEKAEKYIKRAENRVLILSDMRNVVIRKESRASQLAYAFLRGKTYLQTETIKLVDNYRQNYPDCCAITELVSQYTEPDSEYSEMNMLQILKKVLNWAEMDDFDITTVLQNHFISKGIDPEFIKNTIDSIMAVDKQAEQVSS